MNWDRVESARTKARFMLAVPFISIGFLAFVAIAAPGFSGASFGPPPPVLTMTGIEPSHGATGIPINLVPPLVGVFGLLIGSVWMWKLYRAPTKNDEAIWRYRDH